jgi:arsenite methyltransferase
VAQLVFDEELAKHLDTVYRTRDVRRRRALVRAALGAEPGHRVLDAGCGPGFYAAELLEQVGEGGSVVSVDASPQMLAVAARRCEGRGDATFLQADVTSLPVADADFDRALSVQVLEYVADVDAALAEMRRALRPGGRAVVWDVDWSTVSWHSTDDARMARVLTTWDEHLTNPTLPRTLAARLRRAGFADVEVEGHVFAAAELDPETYAGAIFPLIERYVAERDEALAGAWAADQRELAQRGEFFFACVQFCFTATAKP